MKKCMYLIQIGIFALLFASSAMAWDHGWGGHGHRGHGWGHHHGHHGWGIGRPVINNYYAQPQYYAPPQPQYYAPPQPQYYQQPQYYDNRSHQGLAGGVLGTVFGYELGNGHPLAAGVGAAAGSFLGNGMGWRY
ncbi:MAG: hypothetical protein FJ190_08895 [Gammaproteobacteria bacterium]|nr:hypothetical protein [Gammaproteobacteria bacterium]